ncbi:MAG: hypothetical protein HC809_15675 [Gammaproteobacteria bacterium]|nr:hypothetical protein [Gammaproteobacteria bacterium]
MLTRAGSDVVLPYKLARQNGRWQGRLALAGFERVRELVSAASEDVAVEVALDFCRDDEGRCRVQGRAAVSTAVECGRCLKPQPCRVDVAIDLCVVGTEEQASAVSAAVDPYVLSGEEVRITDLVEDDLILGLPNQVCTQGDDCPNRPPYTYGEADGEAGAKERNNPLRRLPS